VTLLVQDMETAQRFYGELFGWRFTDPPQALPPGRYAPALLDGREVAGFALRPAGRRTPSHWTTYLASDDVDATAEQIRHCGGTVGVGPLDARTSGRLAVASDPSGAVFGIWQETDPDAVRAHGVPGAPVWADLVTYAADRITPFYRRVFGHESRADTAGGPEDLTLYLAGVPVASVRGLGSALPHGRGAHWTTYFEAADVDRATQQVSALGGSVLTAAQDGPRGRVAEVTDPEGALFRLVQTRTPGRTQTEG
jgi:predicted enzyme related to lactoylglutathione lyase